MATNPSNPRQGLPPRPGAGKREGPSPVRSSSSPGSSPSHVQSLPIDGSGQVKDGPGSNSTQFFAIPKKRKKAPRRPTPPQAEEGWGRPAEPQLPTPAAQQTAPGIAPSLAPNQLAPQSLAPISYAQSPAVPFGGMAQQQSEVVRAEEGRTDKVLALVLGLFGMATLGAVVAVMALAAFAIAAGSMGLGAPDNGGNVNTIEQVDDDDDEGKAWYDYMLRKKRAEEKRAKKEEERRRQARANYVPPPPAEPAPIVVFVSTKTEAKQLLYSCEDGFRQVADLGGGRAISRNVSPSTKCKLSLQGGEVASYKGATAGRTYRCTVRPPQLVCR